MDKGRQAPAGGVSSILLAEDAALAVAETIAASFVKRIYDSEGDLVHLAVQCRGQHQGPGAIWTRDADENGLPVPLGSQQESLYDVLRKKPKRAPVCRCTDMFPLWGKAGNLGTGCCGYTRRLPKTSFLIRPYSLRVSSSVGPPDP